MIALNLNAKRIYIRGDIIKAYSWLSDYFDTPYMMMYPFPFTLGPKLDITPHRDWTVEHDPTPLNRHGKTLTESSILGRRATQVPPLLQS